MIFQVEGVALELSYGQALRLSYMARFPEPKQAEDVLIADAIDEAIETAEAKATD